MNVYSMHLFNHYASVLFSFFNLFFKFKKEEGSKEEPVAGHPVGNAFLQVAILGLLFIPSRMNSQLEHLAVNGPCLVLLSHTYQSFFIGKRTKC